MTDLIFCVAHSKICCIATKIGFLYGIRSEKRNMYGCGKCKIDFVDINFKKPDKELHREVIMRFKPKYATVLDIECICQIDSAIMEASWLHGHGIEPIVIPKTDCIGEIPKTFILGYSVPTVYGKTELRAEKFEGRKVHILGGTPKAAAAYYRRFLELGCIVTGIDGNAIHKAAARGAVWRDLYDKQWINDYKQPGSYYLALEESLNNTWQYWQRIFADPTQGQLELWKYD